MSTNPPLKPRHLDLKKDEALTVEWNDGSRSVYPIAMLRRLSPSADAKALREEMASNPLTVLPSSAGRAGGRGGGRGGDGPLRVENAEMVGNYAIRLRFSDGHQTGLYSWSYLRSITPDAGNKAEKGEN